MIASAASRAQRVTAIGLAVIASAASRAQRVTAIGTSVDP
ncbi:hypothetical protein RN06_3242 [Mycobacterium tuberculosis variant bovis BCG]|nr:hypothetical protein RN06_3242 [Mycobacterium tuberculosis variant bovis BCG]